MNETEFLLKYKKAVLKKRNALRTVQRARRELTELEDVAISNGFGR